MKRQLVLIMAGLLLCTAPLWSQLPSTIGFQGVLGDATGIAVPDGNHTLTFRLYEGAGAPTPLWTETQNVTVIRGVFSVRLGTLIPLGLGFDRPYYLGISVDGPVELVPRTPLDAVPYALHAKSAATLAPGGTGAVTHVNGADGDVTLEGAGGTTVTRSGNKITIASTGGAGGTGIQGVQNIDGTIAVQNPNGPVATISVADGSVVKGLTVGATTLRNEVTLQAGANVTLTPGGNTITISSVGGSGGTGIQGVQSPDATIAIQNPGGPIASLGLADAAVTGVKIAAGAAVKGLTVGAVTLHDDVTLQAGANVTLTPTGNTVTIAATGGSGGTGIQGVQNTNQTLDIIDGGGPVATINVSGGGIRPAHLADGAVTTTKLADGAVTAAKLAAGVIPTTLPPSGAAGGALGGTYPNPELADNAVTSAKIAAGEVKSIDIADAAVTAEKISGKGASNGEVLVYNGSDVVWSTPPSGGVSGSGTANQLALWNGSSSLNGSTNLVYTGGKLGVGTASPTATLHVNGDEGFLASGAYTSGTALSPGSGTRFHWYPRKAAIRAGHIYGSEWNDASIGAYSTAFGIGTTASGEASVAMGGSTTASAQGAVAMGSSTEASGNEAVAFGYQTTASGIRSFVMGYLSTASGSYSTAMGSNVVSSGARSFSQGEHATASGNNAVAIGKYVSTDSKGGAFVFGDNSTTSLLTATASYQMSMRFAGGYRLFSNSGLSTGVYMNGGVSGWTNYSDRNKKENFTAIDGEALLAKIRLLPVSEWNYKQTDPSIRYIGPMAQDFWQAFRLGGTDSLGINSIAIDGVNLAAVKALEARTSELREKTARLAELEAEVADHRSRILELESQLRGLADTRAELDAIKVLLLERPPVLSPRTASMSHQEE